MRLSKGFIPTLKEIPSDAVMVSHRLMLRAGMIRPLGAGVYSFLPLGYRALRKAIEIVRDEMDAIGGQEFHLPALNPIELWEETGRVKAFGDILFHVKNRPLVLAPTHEEVICQIAANHIKSYRDLPQIWYQIQTKFRNEPRPRSGVIRGRQFLMKDSYSLDATPAGLDKSYEAHAEAYKKIFTRAGLKFFIVGASSGAMGGSASQEFMIESEAGEDTCVICDQCGYAANIEVAASKMPKTRRDGVAKDLKEIHTPNVKTIGELKQFLNVPEEQLAKSLVYMQDKTPVLVLMMGNDQLNEAKLISALQGDVRPLRPEELLALTGADAGSIGPVGLHEKGFKIIADKRLENGNNLISGANKNDYHIMHIDLQRDVKVDGYFDLRVVKEGEPCVQCGEKLRVVTAIELGHVFKLGTKYSDALGATFLDENGNERPIIMGSYGIGVERIIACHIEQHHDSHGIMWGKALAPFQVHLILVNAKTPEVVKVAEQLYQELQGDLIEVLYDDRDDVSPGFKFKDADLLGMPLQVIVGEKNVVNGKVEIKERRTGKRDVIEIGKVVSFVEKYLEG
jgi:prolyl-tRNA synthetase